MKQKFIEKEEEKYSNYYDREQDTVQIDNHILTKIQREYDSRNQEKPRRMNIQFQRKEKKSNLMVPIKKLIRKITIQIESYYSTLHFIKS